MFKKFFVIYNLNDIEKVIIFNFRERNNVILINKHKFVFFVTS